MDKYLNEELLRDYNNYLDLENDKINLDNDLAEAQFQLNALNEDRKNKYREINAIQNPNNPERTVIREEAEAIEKDIAEKETEIRKLEEDIQKINVQIASYDTGLVSDIREYHDIPKRIDKLTSDINELKSEFAEINKLSPNDPKRVNFNSAEARNKVNEMGKEAESLKDRQRKLYSSLDEYESLKGDKRVVDRENHTPTSNPLEQEREPSSRENPTPASNPSEKVKQAAPDYVSMLMQAYKKFGDNLGIAYDEKAARKFCENLMGYSNKYKLDPNRKIDTNDKPSKINMKEAFKKVKKVSLKLYKETLKQAKKIIEKYNIDVNVQNLFLKAEKGFYERKYKVEDRIIKFKDGAIQKYNKAKAKVTTIKKNITKFFEDRKAIKEDYNANKYTIRDSMEKVYGEDKDKHLDYRIINRAIKFKENSCEKINEAKTNIINLPKKAVEEIQKPFDLLHEKMEENKQKRAINRTEMSAQNAEIRRQLEEMKKARTRTLSSNGGFVAISAITLVLVSILTIIIFNIVQTIIVK